MEVTFKKKVLDKIRLEIKPTLSLFSTNNNLREKRRNIKRELE